MPLMSKEEKKSLLLDVSSDEEEILRAVAESSDSSTSNSDDSTDSDSSSTSSESSGDEVPKKKYRFKSRRFRYEEVSDNEFRRLFRMSRRTFQRLLENVEELLPMGESTNGNFFKKRTKVIVTLYL